MAEKKPARRGLGRGLSALMADVKVTRSEASSDPASAAPRSEQHVPIEAIFPNPDQPRRDFPREALEELAASIREKGVIQPLIVRARAAAPRTYEIVAGERRWRAAQLAQLHQLPVLVREFPDAEVLEVAIIENVQRADLNAIEEAMGYRQLIDRFGHTQEKIAAALSKSRSHIANLLRLLQLPGEVQALVRDGALSAGHARALITSANPTALAREVVAGDLSVRETERLAKSGLPTKSRAGQAGRIQTKDADTRVLEQDLSANLGLSVVIDHKGQDGGKVILTYKSLDQLDQLCQILGTAR